MDVYEAIERRRTTRVFKKGATEEELRKIILAGTKAPSAGNGQPWEFVIIDDKHIIDRLAELKYQQNRKVPPHFLGEGVKPEEVDGLALNQKKSFQNSSVVAICSQSRESASAWLCIENMSLTAVADGLGSGIVTYWGKYKELVEEILGLPEGYELTAVLKIGVAGEEGFPPMDRNSLRSRRPEFSWLHKNRF
jgi:nitroreductase